MSELEQLIDDLHEQLVDEDNGDVTGLIEVDYDGNEPDNGLMLVVRSVHGDDGLVVRIGSGAAGLTVQVDAYADGARVTPGVVVLEPTALVFVEH